MGKKMKFPFLFRSTETTSSATTTAAAWPWPACVNNPKTLSFRADAADNGGHNIYYKTMNSAYLDEDDRNTTTTESSNITPDSHFTIRDHLQQESLSAAAPEHPGSNDEETAVVGGMRSDRLFFEPGETSSILEEAKKAYYDGGFPYKDQSVAIVAVDSVDPYLDFRVSMEEMVAAHGLKEWGSLEELLTCFLRVNVKTNHGYIVGAFVDLLLHLSLSSDNNNDAASCSTVSAIDEQCSSSSTTTQYSFTSPLSFSSSTYSSNYSPFLSLMENEDENQIIVDKNVKTTSSSSSSSSS